MKYSGRRDVTAAGGIIWRAFSARGDTCRRAVVVRITTAGPDDTAGLAAIFDEEILRPDR